MSISPLNKLEILGSAAQSDICGYCGPRSDTGSANFLWRFIYRASLEDMIKTVDILRHRYEYKGYLRETSPFRCHTLRQRQENIIIRSAPSR